MAPTTTKRFGLGKLNVALAATAVVLLVAATTCLASEEVGEMAEQRVGRVLSNSIRKLLFAVEIPIAQGRCSGVFTREMIPCYLQQYSPFSSLG